MRFDIGPGGGFLVLAGLVGLSAAVFFLGMISGREMAQTEQDQTQLASVYPMPAGAPAAPPQAAAPEAAAPVTAATAKPPSHEAASGQRTASRESTSINGTAVPPPAPAAAKPERAHKVLPSRPTLASAPIQHPQAPAADASDSDSESDSATDDTDSGASEGATTAAPARSAAPHGKGYNIVIDAAMDHAAANKMASRLLALGYIAHISTTQISGQTWYRVQVGPYPTADDARSAQAQLRAAYTARYVNRAGASSAASSHGTAASDNASSPDSEDTDTNDSGSDDSGGGSDSAQSAPTD
ncbi:MAG TPA: SPOR domain-containing protein [Candidatus Binataceae bacterium]|jgi:DedD protein